MKINAKPQFQNWTREDYLKADIRGIEPMTAKEPLNDRELENMLLSTDYIAEEKLDGTRCTMHLLEGGNRLFSRRISKKTDWYAENTDSVPHLRDLKIKDLKDTILDGEMRIDGREFKDVSSTLNCLYDEAIKRQEELGFITFHAFDIIYYKGTYVAKLPLIKRKDLLRKVVEELNHDYVKEELYTDSTVDVEIDRYLLNLYHVGDLEKYPNLSRDIANNLGGDNEPFTLEVDKRTWYEYILAKGGEGLMLKSKTGTYKHTRGREYTKLKRFETWDVVILDFLEPTKEYTGKEVATWEYWEGNIPVTKHYAMKWIGTVKYGVLIDDLELAKWKKTNPKDKAEIITLDSMTYLVVGECSGMDEETRQYMTKHREELIGTVIEVGANEILKTGKLRHPRFIRFRTDKEGDRCIWKDHIRK